MTALPDYDPVSLRVASLLYEGARRAYGYVPADERTDEWDGACPDCGGDGCEQCGHTGEAS